MKLTLVCHSIRSCWNHGNAHFLRGLLRAFAARGWSVVAAEPKTGWSLDHLLAEAGDAPLEAFAQAFPEIGIVAYESMAEIDVALDGADVVIVHEWTDPSIVEQIGQRRARGGRFRLYFHDTHHRAVSQPDAVAAIALEPYDGILAFCASLAHLYERNGWGRDVHVVHEAADVSRFSPPADDAERRGLVFIGNWGDGERSRELNDYLIGPTARAGLPLEIYGVRWPQPVREDTAAAGGRHHGWISNLDAPAALGRAALTVHIPRRPYVEALPGAPTIRPFEAMACATALVTSPWEDCEGLFQEGRDYLAARNPDHMRRILLELAADPERRAALGAAGRSTIERRHTCAHRAEQIIALSKLEACTA